jgi:YHS domain-containing protein
MLLRQILIFVLILIAARALRLLMQRYAGRRADGGGSAPARGIQMVRDPVCGTFVVPDRAVALADGSRQVYFCSANCRDKYRARTA